MAANEVSGEKSFEELLEELVSRDDENEYDLYEALYATEEEQEEHSNVLPDFDENGSVVDPNGRSGSYMDWPLTEDRYGEDESIRLSSDEEEGSRAEGNEVDSNENDISLIGWDDEDTIEVAPTPTGAATTEATVNQRPVDTQSTEDEADEGGSLNDAAHEDLGSEEIQKSDWDDFDDSDFDEVSNDLFSGNDAVVAAEVESQIDDDKSTSFDEDENDEPIGASRPVSSSPNSPTSMPSGLTENDDEQLDDEEYERKSQELLLSILNGEVDADNVDSPQPVTVPRSEPSEEKALDGDSSEAAHEPDEHGIDLDDYDRPDDIVVEDSGSEPAGSESRRSVFDDDEDFDLADALDDEFDELDGSDLSESDFDHQEPEDEDSPEEFAPEAERAGSANGTGLGGSFEDDVFDDHDPYEEFSRNSEPDKSKTSSDDVESTVEDDIFDDSDDFGDIDWDDLGDEDDDSPWSFDELDEEPEVPETPIKKHRFGGKKSADADSASSAGAGAVASGATAVGADTAKTGVLAGVVAAASGGLGKIRESMKREIGKEADIDLDEKSKVDEDRDVVVSMSKEDAAKSEKKRPKLASFDKQAVSSRWSDFKGQVSAELKGKDSAEELRKERELSEEDREEEHRKRLGNSEKSPARRGVSANRALKTLGKPFGPVKRLYLAIVDLIFSVIESLLGILSRFPLVGLPFKLLLKLTKVLRIVSTILPLVLLVGGVAYLNTHSVPVTSTVELPDNGSVVATNFKYHADRKTITAKLQNTGEVRAEIQVVGYVHSSTLGSPKSWIKPVRSLTCKAVDVRIEIDDSKTVTMRCPGNVPGFAKKATGEVK